MCINISIDATAEEIKMLLEKQPKAELTFSAPSLKAPEENAAAELNASEETLAQFSRVLDEQLEECKNWETENISFTFPFFSQEIH